MSEKRKRGPYKAYLDQGSDLEVPTRSKYFYDENNQAGPSLVGTSTETLTSSNSPLTQHDESQSTPLQRVSPPSIQTRHLSQSTSDEGGVELLPENTENSGTPSCDSSEDDKESGAPTPSPKELIEHAEFESCSEKTVQSGLDDTSSDNDDQSGTSTPTIGLMVSDPVENDCSEASFSLLNRVEPEAENSSGAKGDENSMSSSLSNDGIIPDPYQRIDELDPARTVLGDSDNGDGERENVIDAEDITLDVYISDNEETGNGPDGEGDDSEIHERQQENTDSDEGQQGNIEEQEENAPHDNIHERQQENTDSDEEREENAPRDNMFHPEERPPAVNVVPPTHAKLRRLVQSEVFRTPISTPVSASPAEVLLMVLRMAQVNHLTFKAFVDSARLVNSLFLSPIIPNTSHLLDDVLLSHEGIERFFYCEKCFHSFGKVNHQVTPVLICPEPRCGHSNKIKDLTQATYFVLFPIPAQIELLLMDKNIREKLVNPKEVVKNYVEGIMRDIYDGQSYRDFAHSLPENLVETIISCVFCTDGSPLFKSSNFSIWPFFLSINELPPIMRKRNLILGGLWSGNQHPPMDLFLDPIVDHLKTSVHGFVIRIDDDEVHTKLYGLGCCVDSGARGAVQGLNSHSGYYSCNWCEIAGKYLDHKVIFPFEEVPPKLRSHQDVVKYANECLGEENLAYVYGVQYLSPLHKLPKFDIVKGMVQDFAHNVPFGISRTFLQDWLSNTSRGSYIGSPGDTEDLDMKMAQLKPPIEVRRRPRKISDSVHWNAREYENWTLIYSLPVLEGVLPLK